MNKTAAVDSDPLRELVKLDRRIDNVRHLLAHHEKRRQEIIATLRHQIGRDAPRTTMIDFDARREPKTDLWCIMCQRDLDSGSSHQRVRMVMMGAAPHAVQRDDVALLDLGVLQINDAHEDRGIAAIGIDCARRLGEQWILPAARTTTERKNEGER